MWPYHIPGEDFLANLWERRAAGMDIRFAYGSSSNPDPGYDFGNPIGEDSGSSDADRKESSEEEEEEIRVLEH
jgi:hypothetical protein